MKVSLDRTSGCEVLELNIVLPEGQEASPTRAGEPATV